MTGEVSLDRLSTAALPAAERFAFWEDSLSATLQPVCIEPVRGQRSTFTGHTLLVQADDEPTVHTRATRTLMVLMAVSAAQLSIPMATLRPLMFRPLRLGPGLTAVFANAGRAAQQSTTELETLGVNAYLHGIAELLLRTVCESQPGHAGTAVVRRQQAGDVIRARLGDPALCTAAVAGELGISVRRLQQIFEGEASVAQQIRRLRIARAQGLLRDPLAKEQSIGAIAARCGFADHTNFSRTFRHATGMTPRECRAEMCN